MEGGENVNPDTSIENLIHFIQWEMWIIMGGFAIVIAYKMISNEINVSGLLNDKITGNVSYGRVQMLFITLITAGTVIGNYSTNGSLSDAFPKEILLLSGVSHSV